MHQEAKEFKPVDFVIYVSEPAKAKLKGYKKN